MAISVIPVPKTFMDSTPLSFWGPWIVFLKIWRCFLNTQNTCKIRFHRIITYIILCILYIILYQIQNYLDQTSCVFFQISLQIVKGKSNITLAYVVPSVKNVIFPFMQLTSFNPSKFSWAITTSGKYFWTSQTRFCAALCSYSSWSFSTLQEAAAHL